MLILLLFIVLIIGFTIGVPIFCVLLVGGIVYIYGQPIFSPMVVSISLDILPIKFIHSLSTYILICAPLFMLAGNLMNVGKLTNKLIELCRAFIGHVRGGLALVNILASMFFAGISGSAMADATALGSVLIPGMIDEGYDEDFTCAITAGSSLVGPIIPPSIPFVLYGALSGVPVSQLFLGGIVPGVLMGLFMMIYTVIISKKRNYPIMEKAYSLSEKWIAVKDGIYILGAPIIIIGGLISGYFTPVEAGAIASLYCLLIVIFIYHLLTFSQLIRILYDVGIFASSVLPLVGMAGIISFIFSSEQLPQVFANQLLSISDNYYLTLSLILLLLLFIGMFMGVFASMILLMPILIPISRTLGINSIQFGVLVTIALCIGMNTPPVAEMPYVVAAIGKITPERVFKAIIPFTIVAVIIVMLVACFPQLSTYIPSMVMAR